MRLSLLVPVACCCRPSSSRVFSDDLLRRCVLARMVDHRPVDVDACCCPALDPSCPSVRCIASFDLLEGGNRRLEVRAANLDLGDHF